MPGFTIASVSVCEIFFTLLHHRVYLVNSITSMLPISPTEPTFLKDPMAACGNYVSQTIARVSQVAGKPSIERTTLNWETCCCSLCVNPHGGSFSSLNAS
jgi:hypothetical protein